jgi:hypothetical protein
MDVSFVFVGALSLFLARRGGHGEPCGQRGFEWSDAMARSLILISRKRRKRPKRKESLAKRSEKLSQAQSQVIEIIRDTKSKISRTRVFSIA